MNNKTRIHQLEQDLETTQAAADTLAEELISILRPYQAGRAEETALAIRRVAEKHLELAETAKAVH